MLSPLYDQRFCYQLMRVNKNCDVVNNKKSDQRCLYPVDDCEQKWWICHQKSLIKDVFTSWRWWTKLVIFVQQNKSLIKIVCSPVASVEKRRERREGCLKGWGFLLKYIQLLLKSFSSNSFTKKYISRICPKIWWNHRFQPGSTHVLGDRTGRYTHTVGYSRLLLLWLFLFIYFIFCGGGLQKEEDTHTLSDIPGEKPHILTIISYFFTAERCGPLAWSSCLSQLLEFSPSLSMCSSGDTLDGF